MLNLQSQCGPRDYTFLAPRRIANSTGTMSDDARAMELLGTEYMIDGGVERLIAFIRGRIHITYLSLETEAFGKYFNQLARKKGDTLMKYINAEE